MNKKHARKNSNGQVVHTNYDSHIKLGKTKSMNMYLMAKDSTHNIRIFKSRLLYQQEKNSVKYFFFRSEFNKHFSHY